ncbi:MAG TPA: hypothetical protein VFI69_07510 [Candidatus Limnocylindrales bacterium]|jgi:hypothetical protein|nr:hypothetical protein [Candidatus Limnocylindrales bacterium]
MERSELARLERFRTVRAHTVAQHGSLDQLARAQAAKVRFVANDRGRANARWQSLRTRIVDHHGRSALRAGMRLSKS